MAFKLSKDDQKELRDYYFKLSTADLNDAVVNICMGVRWLYRKHQIAKYYLKKEPSELQIAEEYKGIRNDKSKKAKKQRSRFKELQKELKQNSE